MALYTVTTGNTVLAADINQLENVLQRASGQTENGDYYMGGNAYTTSAILSLWVPSLSRSSTPVSVSIDQSIQSATGGMGSVSTGNLNAGGFQIFSGATGANINPRVGGLYTIQY